MLRTCPVRLPGHQVDVVGQVLPDAADLDGDRRGLAQLALGTDLAGDAGHLGGEPVELVDHGVDRVLQLQHLAADVGRDLLAQVTVRDSADDPLHLDRGSHQVVDEAVDRRDAPAPALRPAAHDQPLGELAFLADHLTDAGELQFECLVGDDDLVEAVGHLAGHSGPVQRHSRGEVATSDAGQDAQEHAGIESVVLGRGGGGHESLRYCVVVQAENHVRTSPHGLIGSRRDNLDRNHVRF